MICPEHDVVMTTDGKRVGFLGLVGYSCPMCPKPRNIGMYLVLAVVLTLGLWGTLIYIYGVLK